MIDIDLMPGALIAALAAAALITNIRATRATVPTRQFRLYTAAAGLYVVAAAVAVATVITNGGARWVAVAVADCICFLLAVVGARMAYEKAAMDAAGAEAAARPPVPLGQMTPLDYTPTKETNR